MGVFQLFGIIVFGTIAGVIQVLSSFFGFLLRERSVLSVKAKEGSIKRGSFAEPISLSETADTTHPANSKEGR